MFFLRWFSCGALAGLIFVFCSCERHHPGELPQVQQEHLDPPHEAATGETAPASAPSASPTPANFFPKPTP